MLSIAVETKVSRHAGVMQGDDVHTCAYAAIDAESAMFPKAMPQEERTNNLLLPWNFALGTGGSRTSIGLRGRVNVRPVILRLCGG